MEGGVDGKSRRIISRNQARRRRHTSKIWVWRLSQLALAAQRSTKTFSDQIIWIVESVDQSEP